MFGVDVWEIGVRVYRDQCRQTQHAHARTHEGSLNEQELLRRPRRRAGTNRPETVSAKSCTSLALSSRTEKTALTEKDSVQSEL